MLRKAEAKAPKKISFHLKDKTVCPICSKTHYKEELLSGGGRLIADKLTSELRRLYKPSIKFGLIYPVAYSMQVCPTCLYAAYPKDFENISEEETLKIKQTREYRVKLLNILFGKVSFMNDRNLILGAASYVLAIDCYHLRDSQIAPTGKIAISSLRAAWLLDDIFKDAGYRPYDKVRDFYYLQASSHYSKTLEYMQSGKEPADHLSYMLGPDVDHNWGYEGILYLNSYLMKKESDLSALSGEEEVNQLLMAKKYLSKIYGTGKSDRGKPSPIVDLSKELFDELTNKIQSIQTTENE